MPGLIEILIALLLFGLLVGGLVAVIVVAVRAGTRPAPPSSTAPRPQPTDPRTQALAELDLRYARGEIDRDDYLQRRHDLAGG